MYRLLQATIANESTLGMKALPDVVNAMNALSGAGAVALAIGVWMLIRPGAEGQSDPCLTGKAVVSNHLTVLLERSTYLRIFLYVGTAGLVAGVLRMNATMTWMQAFLVPSDEPILDPLRITMVSVIGAFYSLMLASIYLPSVVILRERARTLINSASITDDEKAVFRQQFDFPATFRDVFPRIVALLGPLLAGPIGEFLKNLAS
jgi:hypothetical protein